MENVRFAKDLFKLALDRAGEEYKDFTETWKLLDVKAQATATIAGIFIAATFAFVRNTALQVSGLEIFLLILALILLLLCIYWAIRSMVIREVMVPPTAEEVLDESKRILESKPANLELNERFVRLLSDSVDKWVKVNGDLKEKVHEKGNIVARAQWTLLFSIVAFTILTCVAVINK